MNRLIIVGAGGFGRETLAWIEAIEPDFLGCNISGFLDDNPSALAGYSKKAPMIGRISDYNPDNNDRFVMAIGSPKKKLEIANLLSARGAIFITIIHPSAIIGRNVSIGQGCVLCPFVTITSDVAIGDFVTLNVGASVGHDVTINDGCTISPHADITGFARLGKGVFLGSHASIAPKATVGDFATIGIGSVVLKYVKPGITVMGVPAKRI